MPPLNVEMVRLASARFLPIVFLIIHSARTAGRSKTFGKQNTKQTQLMAEPDLLNKMKSAAACASAARIAIATPRPKAQSDILGWRRPIQIGLAFDWSPLKRRYVRIRLKQLLPSEMTSKPFVDDCLWNTRRARAKKWASKPTRSI